MRLEYAPAVFEDLFHRVRLERTGDLSKLLDRLSASSLIMAIQAVYTNLVGLALGLLLTVPMLIVILAIAIFGGPGPVFEEVECLGFQRIPFQRLRFRTSRRDGHPGRTAIGSLIRALRIEGLPQIINVIRGEMALIGPRPVRAEFALRLTEWMPLYAYRFGVKPGMVGWSQVNETGNLPLEPLTTEFDLFYIKQATPLMDLEILLRYLLRPRSRG
jgi:lipopolysaccharide/colanic/teichoic acid biosynthesis glycosyltransferase